MIEKRRAYLYNGIMDDNFKTIYRILSAFEKSLDLEDFDLDAISAKSLGITDARWTNYIAMLVEAEYLSGIEVRETVCGIDIIPETPRITIKGLEYLAENSIMKRMYKAAKGIIEK